MNTSLKLCSFALLAVTLVTGCGDSETSGTQATASAGSAGTRQNTRPTDPIAAVVYEFLNAVRQGDTNSASSKLTPLAYQQTSETDYSFAPPGSATASFAVGQVEKIDAEKAIVGSIWSDLDADGNPSREQITWALRLTEGEWRISGMAAEIGDGQPAVIIDFENPQAIAQQSEATSEDPTARQAQQPTTDPFQQGVNR